MIIVATQEATTWGIILRAEPRIEGRWRERGRDGHDASIVVDGEEELLANVNRVQGC